MYEQCTGVFKANIHFYILRYSIVLASSPIKMKIPEMGFHVAFARDKNTYTAGKYRCESIFTVRFNL